jgi:hypothetical protein
MLRTTHHRMNMKKPLGAAAVALALLTAVFGLGGVRPAFAAANVVPWNNQPANEGVWTSQQVEVPLTMTNLGDQTVAGSATMLVYVDGAVSASTTNIYGTCTPYTAPYTITKFNRRAFRCVAQLSSVPFAELTFTAPATAGSTVTVTGITSPSGGTPDESQRGLVLNVNNRVARTYQTVARPDMWVDLAAGKSKPKVGDEFEWQVLARNDGAGTANNVHVGFDRDHEYPRDLAMDVLSFRTVGTTTAGFSCSQNQDFAVNCNGGTLQPGESFELWVKVKATQAIPLVSAYKGKVTGEAWADADANTVNNSDSHDVTIDCICL